MNYKWNVLYKANNIQEILLNILQWKKIPKEQIREFINFDIKPHSPYLLTNMDKAVNRINKAIENNEKICIIGDYDADGVTATSILYIGLRNLCIDTMWLLPDRFIDGYGINKRLIDVANENKCNLIITVDNGIKAHEQIKYANSLGIEVIVTDHHEFTSNELPTYITINPKIDDSYPFKSICGCMVAFKLVTALIPEMQLMDKLEDNDLYEELLSIATIGTIADVMELVNENRYYVKNGLKYLSNTKNIGLRTLLQKTNLLEKDLSSDDVGFTIGPCINAAGRLESPDIAIKLILSDDPIEADVLATKLIKLNEKRKEIQSKVVNELEIEEDENFIVVKLENIGHGILGIIAGKISEKYQKPCFVLGGNREEGELSGSGRSIYDYDINNVIVSNPDIVISGGGHAAACGVKINYNDLDEFKIRCNNNFNSWLENASPEDLIPKLNIVCEINIELVNERLFNNINKLKPYGTGNEEPIFASKKLKVNKFKIVGKNKNVIQFDLSNDNKKIKAVGFSDIKNKFEELNNPSNIDIVYSIDLNEWPEGVFNTQLIIKDIKKSED